VCAQRVRAKTQARREESLDLIGRTLRDAWRDVTAAPLPERIRKLLDELERGDERQQQQRKEE
jgi:hypothetical protein